MRPKDPLEYERKLAVHRAARPSAAWCCSEPGMTPKVVIYTDGACRGNPGPGGWGAVLIFGEREREIWGGEPATTNNRMELTAAIEALEALNRPCRVELHTDSQYVQQRHHRVAVHLEGARLAHAEQGRGQERGPVAARWTRPAPRHEVDWRWVKGHSGHELNERADALARRGMPRRSRPRLDAARAER